MYWTDLEGEEDVDEGRRDVGQDDDGIATDLLLLKKKMVMSNTIDKSDTINKSVLAKRQCHQ